jgi:hypothetical protein
MPLAVEFEHSSNRISLIGGDFELHSIGLREAAITEYSASRVMGLQRTTLHSAVRLESKFAGIHAIDQAVDTEKNFSLGAFRVHALRYCHQSHASERQSLVKVQSVGEPFDPMNLGISIDYAAAISAQASTKPFELRKPNDQEFFRTSSRNDQHLPVATITDKQDMGRVYIVRGDFIDTLKAKFPKAIRAAELVLTQQNGPTWRLAVASTTSSR